MKIEYVKADSFEYFYKHIFSGREARAFDLLTALEQVDGSVPLGWQYKSSLICRRLWSRKGGFISAVKTFSDAFDYTYYEEKVWNFSENGGASSVKGIEFHGWGARPAPENESDIIVLENTKELKTLLSAVPADMSVFSPSNNFELHGALKNEASFYCTKDSEGKLWLVLEADSLAGH